jgi:hypothetical protein
MENHQERDVKEIIADAALTQKRPPVKSDPEIILELFNKLIAAELQTFPVRGTPPTVPTAEGVYVIYGSQGKVLYVGMTTGTSGRQGLQKRLATHPTRKPGRKFRCLPVKSGWKRRYLEHLAIGSLCPNGIQRRKVQGAWP